MLYHMDMFRIASLDSRLNLVNTLLRLTICKCVKEVKNEKYREYCGGLPAGGPGETFISLSRMSRAQGHIYGDRSK